jgi:glycine cleavage system H protein
MAEQYKNFMGYLWFQKEDNVFTVGLNEDGLDMFEEINSLELPPEGEVIEADVVVGSIETDQGPIDIYAPVSGTISEINSAVLEDATLIQDDPFDAWLFKIESEEEFNDENVDDEDEDDDEDDDDLDEEEDSEDEED